MIFFLEVAPPFRLLPNFESVGALRFRIIWLWFSFGLIQSNFNQMCDAAEDLRKAETN